MIWEIHLSIFDTFTKGSTCGKLPGRMSRVRVGVVIFMFLVFSCFRACTSFQANKFFLKKSIIFTENSAKIINFIFEPFPN